MKIFVALVVVLSIFALSAEAGKKKRCGTLVTANCDSKTYQSCPANNPICGYKQVLLQEKSGCCCHGKCGANEEYGCGCSDKVCNQPDKICIQCLNDCYCAEGFVRDVEGGKCIPAKECPAAIQCSGEFEEPGCKCYDAACGMMYPQVVCKKCNEGCYCAEGYIRKAPGGKCIPNDQCEPERPSQPEEPTCGENEIFNCICRDSICNQPDIVCVRCEDGCHCAEGYVRDFAGGKCIPNNQCEPVEPPRPQRPSD